MGLDYALVHLHYTIPPAVLLTAVYMPLFTWLDAYKILFLILVAVTATIPWDSFLIRSGVWGYPPDAVLGTTLVDIPLEEVFFFVIQTYNTSLLYLLLSKPTFHLVYLAGERGDRRLTTTKWTGAFVILSAMALVESMVHVNRQVFYIRLIFIWAGPFLLLLWLLAYQFIINLPWTNTFLPIALSTLYLWIVDTIALRRGTWVIEKGTKLEWQLWRGLDFEEAAFFAVSNTMIVFGQVAFDNALAILDLPFRARPSLKHKPGTLESPSKLVRALLIPVREYDESYISGMQGALDRLRRKSGSFYLASCAFPYDLRKDLILLYSYCRLADDLVDEPSSTTTKQDQIQYLYRALEIQDDPKIDAKTVEEYAAQHFPTEMQFALRNLPMDRMSRKPLFALLEGFAMDLQLMDADKPFQITDEDMLEQYSAYVASTVAEMCTDLVRTYSSTMSTDSPSQREILSASRRMGIALQYVNISRDIRTDARLRRVYLPATWLAEYNLKAQDILEDPDRPEAEQLRQRLLRSAFNHYRAAHQFINNLPPTCRGPVRVMIESYMEIGRTLQRKDVRIKNDKPIISPFKRFWVAWRALSL